MENYPIINWGDSEAMQVGDIVLAIGAPFGLTQTVTHGIISAKGRSDVGISDFEDFLQTDAPINPGNSGGPLVNARGEIIGMNSAIATSIGQSGGVGFAIPSNMIKAMLPKILKGEPILRGELGIGIQNLTEDLARHFGIKDLKGVLVSQVTPNSSAEKSGIKVGDIITNYDGKPVEDARVLRNLVAGSLPGSKVKIDLVRNQRHKTIQVAIGGQSRASAQPRSEGRESQSILNQLGLTVETLTKDLALRLQTKETSGVAILNVDEGSAAAFTGLREGDIIIQANRKPVKNLDDLNKILSQLKNNTVLLLVKRQGASIFFSIQVG
jgi:serine protease Do